MGGGGCSYRPQIVLHNKWRASNKDYYYCRLLTKEEGLDYTNCVDYSPTPDGNIINTDTRWNITGTLIKKISLSETDILCKDRTVFVPVRYRTFTDAMTVCEQLGERGGTYHYILGH